MKLIDAERKVHCLAYDDEHEENIVRYMTVEEMLDKFTDEGCPTTFDPVKHGRWEWIGGYGYQYRCSECIRCAERQTKYCPNCGAYMMDEVEND